jgi:hypothetical protein
MLKIKPEKIRHFEEIKTLDESHRKIEEKFRRRRNMLPKKKEKLKKLEKKLEKIENKDKSEYEIKDIRDRSNIRTQISELKREIFDIENNISEIEYYSQTNDLLMDYYDLLEYGDEKLYENNPQLSEAKVSSESDFNNYNQLDRIIQMKTKKRRRKKTTSRRKRKDIKKKINPITSYWKISTNNKNIHDKNAKNKAELFEQYKIITDNEYHSEKIRKKRELKKCPFCDKEKTINQSEGISVCENCGIFDMIIIESEKPNYKDSSMPEKPGYPYKRVNHFNEYFERVIIYTYAF